MKLRAILAICVLALVASVVAPVNLVAAKEEPVIIVFDVSGSMNEQDSAGTVKLETAKKAMTELARARDGLPMGLWTYPGGDMVDGCPVGSWVRGMSPSDRPDSSEVSAQIGLLSANGGTPTGPALRAVAESLQAQGYDEATIILVSDGESNCGVSPCDVAKEVVASGFDLTVAAVAFDIEEGGQGELQCIAQATGGTYAEAKESAELLEQLEALQPTDLELTVSAPSRVQAGEFVHCNVVVRNPGSEPVTDTSLLLTVDNQDLIPMVPAPHKRLPAIPAGGQVQQQWSLGTRSSRTGEVHWTVVAGSRTLGAVSQRGTTTVTDLPLTRQDGGEVLLDQAGSVLVMGDSYSSGEGARPYLPEDEGFQCHRSEVAYGRVLDSEAYIMACSGATSGEMMGERLKAGQPPQFYLLPKADLSDVALMTIGGNDIQFADIVTQCFIGDCAEDRDAYLARVERLDGLAENYQAISRAVNSPEHIARRNGAIAPLIVSPYPNPFWSHTRGQCNGNLGIEAIADLLKATFTGPKKDWEESIGFAAKEIRMSEELLSKLNNKIESEVAEAAAAGYPVYFADSVQNFAVGHSICEEDSYFVRLTAGQAAWRLPSDFITHAKQEMFHPNQAGHRAWANALISWSQRAVALPITELPKKQESALEQLIDWLMLPVLVPEVVITPSLAEPGELGAYQVSQTTVPVTATGEVTVKLTGLMPGTNVRITVESASQVLATPTVAEDGTVEARVKLPALSAGGHQLVIEGYDEAYQLVGQRIPLQVDSGLPILFVLVAGFALVAAGAVVALALLRRRIRNQVAQVEAAEAAVSAEG